MQLCLVRHAIAVERESWQGTDADRPLTEKGRQRMVAAAPGLARLFVPEVVFTSPLLRARDTAEILAQTYRLGSPVVRSELATGDANAFIRALGDSEASAAMAVGHEPHISALLALLLTGSEGGAHTPFKKGGAALIESEGPPEPGHCRLVWFLPPNVLRMLKSG